MVHRYNRILLNCERIEIGSFVEMRFDLEAERRVKLSQKEIKQISYIGGI